MNGTGRERFAAAQVAAWERDDVTLLHDFFTPGEFAAMRADFSSGRTRPASLLPAAGWEAVVADARWRCRAEHYRPTTFNACGGSRGCTPARDTYLRQ